MKHVFTGFNLIGAVALLALAVGCANTQQTENLLSAAGFRTVIANTPQRQQHLKTLPPDKVTLVQRNGKNYYVYADPAHWQIFVGTPSQYQKYQQLRLANNLAQDQLETAQMNSMTAHRGHARRRHGSNEGCRNTLIPQGGRIVRVFA
jgi:hypothetical protein